VKEKRNAIYCCCIAPVWPEVAKILDREHGISPAYYIGWRDDGSSGMKESFPQCHYQSVEDAWKGLGFPEMDYSVALDEEKLRLCASEHIVALRMMDRLDATRHDFPLAQRERFFHHLLSRWLLVLESYDISLAIFPVSPHRVFDYLLYIACKMRGVRTILFQMTLFADASYIVEDIDSLADFMKRELQSPRRGDEPPPFVKEKVLSVLDDYEKNIPEYMKRNLRRAREERRGYLRRALRFLKSPALLFEKLGSYRVERGKMPYDSSLSRLEEKMIFWKNSLYLKRLKRHYESLCSDISAIEEKFVFFPLHYQPEETSCPTGGFFGDQILLLSLLDAVLPEGVSILVKEHTSQFLPTEEGASSRFPTYYDEMKRVSSRVRFVSTSVDPFTLIDAAEAVVTISGTTGWESAIRGTPVLHFGRAWYECMPGTFRIDGKESLERAIEAIFTGELRYDMEDIMAYHERLSGFFISALHYKAYKGRSRRSTAESAANLAEGIVKYLERSKETHVKSSSTR